MFCIIESNSQKPFFSLVLCTNMAAMTSDENHPYVAASEDEERKATHVVRERLPESFLEFHSPSESAKQTMLLN